MKLTKDYTDEYFGSKFSIFQKLKIEKITLNQANFKIKLTFIKKIQGGNNTHKYDNENDGTNHASCSNMPMNLLTLNMTLQCNSLKIMAQHEKI